MALGLLSRVIGPKDKVFPGLASWIGSPERLIQNLDKKLVNLGLQRLKKRGDTSRLPARMPAVISPTLRDRQLLRDSVSTFQELTRIRLRDSIEISRRDFFDRSWRCTRDAICLQRPPWFRHKVL